jgi:hypothetical protein
VDSEAVVATIADARQTGPGEPAIAERPATPVADAVVGSLEAIRSAIHRHLNRLEAAGRVAAEGQEGDSTELHRRLIEMEEEVRRSHAEAEWCRSQADTLLCRVEEERSRIAGAWEELEQERIRLATRTPAHQAPEAVAATPCRSTFPTGDHPIAHAILQQYQSLHRDVRMTADQRRGS